MNHVVLSRILSALVLSIPVAFLLHLFFVHDVQEKMTMSGDEIHQHYQQIGPLLMSPLNAAFLAILNLAVLIALYEGIAAAILALLRPSGEKPSLTSTPAP